MRFLGQRVQIGWFATSVMALCGLVLGAVIGCGLVVADANIWLSSHANLAAAQTDFSLSDAHRILTLLKESPYAACSDQEIAYLRGLVWQSPIVRDAGRLEGGTFACSATGNRVAAAQLQPTLRLKDGTTASMVATAAVGAGPNSGRAASGSDAHGTLLTLDGGYVVFDTRMPVDSGPLAMQLSVSTKGSELMANKSAAGIEAIDRFSEGSGRMGSLLYATRCTPHGLACATATTPIGAAIYSQAGLISTSAFGGAMAGVLVSFAFSFRYKRRRELKQQLRRAAEGDELSVAYQPIVDLETQQIVGAEALARWKDEEGNEIKPDVFVKIAEEFGFVGAITKTVLKRTLHDFAATMRERPEFRISINVAAADLSDPEFLPMLQDALKRARVKPQNLVIELTERSAADNPVAMETIQGLRKLGHSIHIDDFGTGYSNLDKLLYLFADTIKIDKAFTGVIGTESAGAAILPQILAMAESLNLEVVVEGVETYRQADYFQPGQQKIYAQGWLYGRPVTAPEFLTLLAGEQTIMTSPEEISAFTTRPGTLRIVSQQPA